MLPPAGTVIIAGGLNDERDILDTAKIFAPATDPFTLLKTRMNLGRYDSTRLVLMP